MREQLANALVNAVVYAGAGAAGLALVDELRALQRAWPEDGAVRERLAKALFNAFNDAGAGAAGLALVDELRALQRAWPEDAFSSGGTRQDAEIFGRRYVIASLRLLGGYSPRCQSKQRIKLSRT